MVESIIQTCERNKRGRNTSFARLFAFRMFAISAIVEVHIEVVQGPALTGPLSGGCSGTCRTRQGELVVRRVATFLSVLVAGCSCGFALNPSLDISQSAHTAWTVRSVFIKGNIYTIKGSMFGAVSVVHGGRGRFIRGDKAVA
jgi:hypothetical protein